MTDLLHEQIDSPEGADTGDDETDLDAEIHRRLDLIEESAAKTLGSRLQEVRTALGGETPEAIAETGDDDTGTTVTALRVMDAASRLQRQAAQLYALAARRKQSLTDED